MLPGGAARTAADRDGGSQAVRARAFDLAYNLDRGPALALLDEALAAAPADAALHRSVASLLWLDMLFSRGAVTVDESSSARSKVCWRRTTRRP